MRRILELSKLGPDDARQVEEWLEVAPAPASVDPKLVPRPHRGLFLDSVRALVYADGKVDRGRTREPRPPARGARSPRLTVLSNRERQTMSAPPRRAETARPLSDRTGSVNDSFRPKARSIHAHQSGSQGRAEDLVEARRSENADSTGVALFGRRAPSSSSIGTRWSGCGRSRPRASISSSPIRRTSRSRSTARSARRRGSSTARRRATTGSRSSRTRASRSCSREIYRVLAKDSHFYLFCDPETMFVAKPLAEAAGFKFWKPLVWDKQRIGMGYHYRARYECILFFEKGKRKLADLGDRRRHRAPARSSRLPGGEARRSVARCSFDRAREPGELVIDPFMGSGSTGVAAVSLGRRFLGTDISRCRARALASTALRGRPRDK